MKWLSAELTLLVLPLLGTGEANEPCAVLDGKHGPGETVSIRAVRHAAMHGTYLTGHGCATSLLLVLPEEIPGYRGAVKTVKDGAFNRFLTARYDYRADAPAFEALFAAPSKPRTTGVALGTTETSGNALCYCPLIWRIEKPS